MRTIHFKREDIEYPILFDSEIAEQIQKEYGNLTAVMQKVSAFDLNTTAWLLHLMIQEGVLFQNDLTGMRDKPPTLPAVKRLLTHPDLYDPEFVSAITDTFMDFMGGNVTGQDLLVAGLEILKAGTAKASK